MNQIPETRPISDMRLHQSELLAHMRQAPVVLTQHGRAAVVLVDPEQWNRLLEQYEDLQLALDAVESRQDADECVNSCFP